MAKIITKEIKIVLQKLVKDESLETIDISSQEIKTINDVVEELLSEKGALIEVVGE